MSAARLCLNDLIRAQRAVGMTTAHRAANLARLTSRVAQFVAMAAAGTVASTAVVGSARAATGWLAKFTLGLALVGGVGVAYRQVNPPAPGGSASRPTQREQTQTQPMSGAPAAPPGGLATPASPVPAPGLPGMVTQAATPPASKIPSVATPATAPASLAVEVQLMREIDSALKSGRPDRALALLEQRRDGDGG
jgi:hypothetical protein